jgi:NTE family protein
VRDFPVEGEGHRSPAFRLHLNRLAREIGQCRIGIALSSGGAKGLAHVGVIQVLEENGIEIDVIAGSSMGAYVGSLWAHGYTGEALERIARELESRWGLLYLVDPVVPPREGFIRTRRTARRLQRSIGDSRFSELIRPLRVVATQLETMERVIFSSGEVVKAVEASIAIPGICVPVTIDGETYIDGGIADPLPVDVLVEMGIERIIAVNTIPTPEQLRHSVDEGENKPEKNEKQGLTALLSRHLNYFAHGNILDTMFRSTHGVQMRLAEAACKDADVVLWAISSDAKWHDFTNPGKYIALGRRVAEAHLSEIKALIKGDSDETSTELAKSVAVPA